jgi:hypothetical protein
MFLDYFALAITLMGLLLVFYTFIFIHDIPYEIAKANNHPHAEVIHMGSWVSLFTLHALWPLLFLWAKMNPGPMSVRIEGLDDVKALHARIVALEAQVKAQVQAQPKAAPATAPQPPQQTTGEQP